MNIVAGNPASIVCDRCGVGSLDPLTAIAAVGTGYVKILHPGCIEQEYQFLVAGQARTVTVAQLFSELQASVGL